MLILRNTPASPFGRKVLVAATHLGLDDRVEVVAADTADPSDDLRRQNPLGKLPVLVLEDGTALYDSPVILECLDEMAGGGRILPRGEERFAVLRLQALCDGLLDAALLQVYERRYRPENMVHQPWLDYQAEKIARTLAVLEEAPPAALVDAGTITLACALDYLDFRLGKDWRANHPRLVAWQDRFGRLVPRFAETAPR